MTSVSGAVSKVSSSITGYVNARNHDDLDRLGRDLDNNNGVFKATKFESDDSLAEATTPEVPARAVDAPAFSTTKFAWIDESTRTAHWHQVAHLAQAVRDLSSCVTKGQAYSSPFGTEGCLCMIGSPEGFQRAGILLETIYSGAFLAKMREMYKTPQPTMEYAIAPDEYSTILSTKSFLDQMPNDCAHALAAAGVSSRVMKGVSTDLGAILDRKPIPGLVQRAGFFDKIIKFFRGDRFGFNSTDDTMPTLDSKFPGRFPSNHTKDEMTLEGRSGAGSASSEGLSKHRTSRPFIPVALTDTYSYVCDHNAKMETTKVSSHGIFATAIVPTVSPLGVKKGGSPALKRLQRSRHMKKVHFSPSSKPFPLPLLRPTTLLSKILCQRSQASIVVRDRSTGSQFQGKRSPSISPMSKPAKDHVARRLSYETNQEKASRDGEIFMPTDLPRTVRPLSERLVKQELHGLVEGARTSFPSRSSSPLTLEGLKISDDKEDELGDLSVALQLKYDEDEARQRAEVARKAKEAEDERLRKSGGLRAPLKRLVAPLSRTWVQQVHSTLTAHSSETLATTAENVNLRRHDFSKVIPPTEWLNDEIVNGSLLWLDRYINKAAGAPEVRSPHRVCLVMNSFFFKRLEETGVQNTDRTLRRFGVTKENFLNLETILMPICKRNHWTLLVVRPQKRTVSHMDSLSSRGTPAHTHTALNWIQAVLGNEYRAEEWRTVRHEAPQQTNGYDCGVFTITNGICLALGINAVDAYDKEELPLQRLRLAAMLLNRGFEGDFDLTGI